MNDPARFWADPRLVYTVAATAVALLVVTIWLFRRRSKQGRQAAVICLMVSIALHLALIVLVPMLPSRSGGSSTVDKQSTEDAGIDAVDFSSFDPDMEMENASGQAEHAPIAPLPVADLTDLLTAESTPDPVDVEQEASQEKVEPSVEPGPTEVFDQLVETETDATSDSMEEIDSQLSDLLDAALAEASVEATTTASEPTENIDQQFIEDSGDPLNVSTPISPATGVPGEIGTPATAASTAQAQQATVAGSLENDFANRVGDAKQQALLRTGGSEQTEAAVEAALRFLAQTQRPDGAWDPRGSAGGVERKPLGISRGGAGSRAETAITGLALLAMMGAGNTHRRGEYAENVYRGLAYLIRQQQPSGSLAGKATVNAATYCHGMAALAMCEAAAITRDDSAIQSSRRALAYTRRIQHPTTGGWRYRPGDPGDLSQLGWQAMVLDAGHRAEIEIDPRAVAGVQRFLRRVRMGAHGGLATYRPGEAPSRTMTAEALATRLLIGEQVPGVEIAEAERYLLQQLPGVGKDNYYYWYYATVALHQLQDDAWQQWNEALKRRLLMTQRNDGGWSSDTLWGGYGGTVYTTSMAALCLETYYRHAIRGANDRIATQPNVNR